MSDFSFLDPFQSVNIPLGDWVEDALNLCRSQF